MDGISPAPPDQDKPGAPELSKSVKASTPTILSNTSAEPVFKPTPTSASEQPAADSSAVALNDAADTSAEQPDPTKQPGTPNDGKPGNGRQPKAHKKHLLGKILLIIIVVLLLGAAVGDAAYWHFHKRTPGKASAQTAQSQSTAQTKNPTTTPTTNAQAGTKTYTSTNFQLGISYPEDWTPTETNQALTITSPITELTDAGGQTTEGEIILTVRHKQTKPAEYSKGAAVAVLASEKVNYTSPTSSQRKSTYLSFLQYAQTTVKGGLDGIYITGDLGYKYAQNVPQTDIAQVDPLVDVTFVRCAASDQTNCTTAGQTPLTISSTMWKSSDFKTPIASMLESLTLN